MRRAVPHFEPGEQPVLGAKHKRRIELMLLLGSGILIVSSLFWVIYFLLRQQWLVVPLEASLVAVGVGAVVLTLQQRLKAATMLLLGSLLVCISTISLVFDVPTAEVHRGSHHFLPAVGVCAYLLLRGQSKWLQHGAMLTFFVAYYLLDGTHFGLVEGYNLPEDVRAVSLWMANVMASLTLFMAIYVMQSDVVATNVLEAELREALVDGQFVLHYQPQVDAEGHILGAEALTRWQHPTHGLLVAADFIGLAEQTGLILPLGDWVLKRACVQLAQWAQKPELAGIQLAVNVSAQQLRQPDFVQQVLSVVERCGVQPGRLKLELTESMLVDNVDDVIAKMTQLKAHGVVFSLDDFGTGYSSLSYLKHLPLDQLKIDRAFVSELLTSANDAAIAKTVVSLGRNLGLNVIAEGVETEGQLNHLKAIGCEAFQGYWFSKPLPLPEFDIFVITRMRVAQAYSVLPS